MLPCWSVSFISIITWNFEPMSYLWNLLSVIICGWRVSVWSSFSGVMWVYWKIKPKAKNVLDFTQICSLFATSLAWGGVVWGGGVGEDEVYVRKLIERRLSFKPIWCDSTYFMSCDTKGWLLTYVHDYRKRSNWKFCVLVRHQESFKCLLLCEITVTKLSDWYSMVLINLPEL